MTNVTDITDQKSISSCFAAQSEDSIRITLNPFKLWYIRENTSRSIVTSLPPGVMYPN
jgi:hypothetical protein